ncbi:3-keto-steroid reductase, variant 2 [Orbilia brochopaga]
MDWLKVAQQFMTGVVNAMTEPRYQVQGVGWLTEAHAALDVPQLSKGGVEAASADSQSSASPDLGMVFTANVFGHYYLIHEIMTTLHAHRGQEDEASRVIWIGSIDSNPHGFDIKDIQGIKSTTPYQSSKTLTDILVLGHQLPQTEKQYRAYVSTATGHQRSDTSIGETIAPVFLVAHPGIISTTIVALPWWQTHGKILGFWLCKALGSPWHCIDPYIGANAPVWLALSPHVEMAKGTKWGSGSGWRDTELIIETKVDIDVARYSEEVWAEMERLRSFWKSRLDSRA